MRTGPTTSSLEGNLLSAECCKMKISKMYSGLWLLGSVISISSDVGGPRRVVGGCIVCLVDRRLSGPALTLHCSQVMSRVPLKCFSEATALRYVVLVFDASLSLSHSEAPTERCLHGKPDIGRCRLTGTGSEENPKAWVEVKSIH